MTFGDSAAYWAPEPLPVCDSCGPGTVLIVNGSERPNTGYSPTHARASTAPPTEMNPHWIRYSGGMVLGNPRSASRPTTRAVRSEALRRARPSKVRQGKLLHTREVVGQGECRC